MSFVLFSAGRRHAPRTAARRVLWGVLALAPLGGIGAAFTIGAVLGWAGEWSHSETIWLIVFAASFDLVFAGVLVAGIIAVLLQAAQERETRSDP